MLVPIIGGAFPLGNWQWNQLQCKGFYKKVQSAKEVLREVRKLLPSKEIVGYCEVDVK